MSFVPATRASRDERPARLRGRKTRPAKPAPALVRVEQLEARETPAVSLVDVNASFLGAGNGAAEILGITPNGRYAIFASTANDIIPLQNDTPGTRDLFWIDFLTGARKLVTGAPVGGSTTTDKAGNVVYNYRNTTTSFSRAFPGVESFKQAVISDDGQFVAFTSKVDAGVLDVDYATPQQFALSKRTTLGDRGDASYDAFRWGAKDQLIRLASRTFDDTKAGAPTEAFGARADVKDIAINGDGSKVTFVSNRDAKFAYEQVADGKPGSIRDNLDASDDLFMVDFIRIENKQPQNTACLTLVTNPYFAQAAKFPSFFWRQEFGTFGFVSQFQPLALLPVGIDGNGFSYVPVIDTTTGIVTFTDVVGEPFRTGGTSKIGVRVDDLGRYMVSDGSDVAYVSDINPAWTAGLVFDNQSDAPVIIRGQLDVYVDTVANVDLGVPQRRSPTRLLEIDPTNPVALSKTVAATLAVQGGTAENAIIARDKDDRIMFTAAIGDATNGSLFNDPENKGSTTTYNGPLGTETKNLQLFMRQHPPGQQVGLEPVLVNAINTDLGTPGAPISISDSFLPIEPGSTGGSPRIDRRSYAITPDGAFAVFTSSSAVLIQNATDKNNAFDVFRRDLNNTTVLDPNTGVTSPNPDALKLVSVDFTNNATRPNAANAKSYNPAISPDGRFVGFESLANNIVRTGVDTNAATDIYLRDMEAGKNAKGVVLGLTGLVSANIDGTAAGDDGPSTFDVKGVPDKGSYRPFVGTGRVVFTSTAGNLTPALAVAKGTPHGYAASVPLTSGVTPVSVDVGAVSGGFQAGAALVQFTGNGNLSFSDKFTPFPGFTGELRVAAADVNFDGAIDLIVGSGPGGGPRVVVIDGLTGGRTLTRVDSTGTKSTYSIDFFAFESSFRGGVTIASADVNLDGFSDLIIGADQGGGSRVRVISGFNGKTVLADFFAYEATFRGGVRVGTADVNGDGTPDVITGAGFGGGPRVSVFSFVDPNNPGQLFNLPNRIVDVFAFEPTLRNGVYVGGGDINGDGFDEVVIGGGPGGGPRVLALDGKSLFAAANVGPTPVVNFFAFPDDSRDGVRVAVRDIDGDGNGDLVTGQGVGQQSRVRTYQVDDPESGRTPVLIDDQILFGDFGSLNGAWVG